MAQLTADFEVGANGSDVLTTDPGSATAWDVRTVSGGTLKYDNTHQSHGSLAMKADNSASAAVKRIEWGAALGTVTDHYGRFYLFVDAFPASDTFVCFVNSTGSRAAAIRLQTTGTYQIFDSVGIAATSASPITVATAMRFEYHFIHSTTVGVVEVKDFNGDSTSANQTTSASSRNTLASANSIMYGCVEATTTPWSGWWDDIIANATDYPGPFVPPPPPTDVMLPGWSRTRFNG